ncbi:hypothetical protein J4H86_10950 [Spiractinospora alimapuensis]|uniref:DoxX-like family protein n=1 Tax=Spiractinospora alimapuensis TaxID=2820884 RepID=UPI001F2E43B4|nr:DoxX-like family protein [Spiractinospora alimapuensis]QVQ54158.1 hypothetical protein J4H86_10950 [Spiractinospora alimapuensis]
MHSTAATVLAIFLVGVGIAHFVLRDYFRGLVPGWAPWSTVIVLGTGLVEIVLGVLVAWTETRAVGAWGAAALITGYLASHLDALWRVSPQHPSVLDRPVGVAARLVVNGVYIAWAVAVATTVG